MLSYRHSTFVVFRPAFRSDLDGAAIRLVHRARRNLDVLATRAHENRRFVKCLAIGIRLSLYSGLLSDLIWMVRPFAWYIALAGILMFWPREPTRTDALSNA